MQKLYEVIKTYYVMAENESEAESITPEVDACQSEILQVGKDDFIDPVWRESIPFNSVDDKTVEQIQEEMVE